MLRDELSVLAAFAAVAVGTSALSLSIRGLEEHLGVRLIAPPLAVAMTVSPKLARFTRDYPEVVLDITTDDDSRRDLVAARFDAGIHLGEFLQRDLTAHRCINYRMGAGGVYRWEFEKRGQPVTVSVSGPLVVDDVELVVRAALDGLGLAYLFEERAAPHIARGELVRVLEDWCPPFAGSFLHYPSRRQQPAALQALVDTLRV